jgi:uncharacterized protein (DUF2141 family)
MRLVLVLVGSVLVSFVIESLSAEETNADSSSGVGTIEVVVEGVRTKDEGVLIVSLFNGEDGWLELESALALTIFPATDDTLITRFENLPYDSSYAIQVIHDKNENGKFDMRWFPYPKPKEGAGVSNNNLRRGPPKYEKAKFTLAEQTRVMRIRLQY